MGESHGLSAFSPKQTFILGIVGGVLVLCAIGFFVLLGVVLRGDSDDSGSVRKAGAALDNGAAIPDAPSGKISFRPIDDNDHLRGKKDAKITILEYSDFECPFCGRFHPTMQQVMEQYGDQVRWVYRHFPLESIHPKARSLANASECAAEQDKFWEMADAVFVDSGAQPVETYATKAGLNLNKFTSCLNAKKYDSEVSVDAQDALAAGAQGTPYSLIIGPNGETVPISGAQPFAAVEAALQQFLK